MDHPLSIALLQHTASSATFLIGEPLGFRTLSVRLLSDGHQKNELEVVELSSLNTLLNKAAITSFVVTDSKVYFTTAATVWRCDDRAMKSSAIVVAGHPTEKNGDNDAVGSNARFMEIRGMCLDEDGGSLLIADFGAKKTQAIES